MNFVDTSFRLPNFSLSRDQTSSAEDLVSKIRALSIKPANPANIESDEWSDDKNTIIEAVCLLEEKKCSILDKALQELFEKLPQHAIDDILATLAVVAIEKKRESLVETSLKFVGDDRMEGIYREKGDTKGTIKELAELLEKHLPKTPEPARKKSFWLEMKRAFSFIINFIPNVINTFLIAFSFYDIGKEPQSAWEASALLDVYYKFIMIPAAIVFMVSVMLPGVGSAVYLITAAVLVGTFAALLIYIKWLKPCPSTLPYSQNLTLDAKLGYLAPVIGREDKIQQLVSLFTDLDSNTSNHAILVGPSGVGKTEIVKGLAQRIAKGDVPKQLKKKKIFAVNTASLVQGGQWGYADQMNFLLNRVKGYENEVIFFFDEIHAAMKGNSCLSDFLKPLLDRGKIHCIAATTSEEFDKYIRGNKESPGDSAFARRFKRIDVDDMCDSDTKRVLQTLARDSSRGVHVEDAALEAVIEKTNEVIKATEDETHKRHQPAFAVEVLTHAVNAVAASQDPTFVPPELSEMESQLKSLKESMTADCNSFRPYTKQGKEYLRKVQELEKKIRDIKTNSQEKKEQVTRIKALLQVQKQRQQALGKLAAKALKPTEIRIQRKRLKQFFFEVEYYLPQLQAVIDKLKKEVCDDHFNVSVDPKLVGKIIGEIGSKIDL